MAATLEKTGEMMVRRMGEGETETRVMTSAMLQGGDRNVTLLGTSVQVTVEGEAGGDGVAVHGQADFSTEYRTAEGQLHQRRTQCDFSAQIPVEGEGKPWVCATLRGVEAQEKDGRLDLSAEISIKGVLLAETQQTFVTHVDAGEYLACKVETLRAVAPFAAGDIRELVSETLTPEEGAVRVATANAEATVESVQFMEGTARVQGNVALSFLLAAEDDGLMPESTTLPFDLLLDQVDFHREMQGIGKAAVHNFKADILYTLEKEKQETALRVEYVLEASVVGWETREHRVLEDCYPLSELPLAAVQESITYLSGVQSFSQTRMVPVEAESANGFSCQLAALECGGDPLTVEGLLLVSPLAQEGQTRIEVPFSLEFGEIPAEGSLMRVQILAAQGKTQTMIPVTVSCMTFSENTAAVLSAVEETEPVAPLPAGVILYYPAPGEDRWTVAKHCRVRQDALREGKAGTPLMLYRRLTEGEEM